MIFPVTSYIATPKTACSPLFSPFSLCSFFVGLFPSVLSLIPSSLLICSYPGSFPFFQGVLSQSICHADGDKGSLIHYLKCLCSIHFLLFFLMLIIFVISNYRISAYFKSTICFRISIISDYKYISDYLIFLIPNEISMYDLLPSM